MTARVHINRQKRIDWAWGYGMILPLLAGLGIFYFYPVFKVFRDSLYNVGAFNRSSWAGLSNYTKMFQDGTMWQSLGNTLMYAVIIIPLTVVLALILAALLNTRIRGRDVFRVIFFIPTVTMAAAIAMVLQHAEIDLVSELDPDTVRRAARRKI